MYLINKVKKLHLLLMSGYSDKYELQLARLHRVCSTPLFTSLEGGVSVTQGRVALAVLSLRFGSKQQDMISPSSHLCDCVISFIPED